MRGIATIDERQMVRERTGWECCNRCDSPIACAKDACCARFGDEWSPDSEMAALAADYEAGLVKMLRSNYEEHGPEVIRKSRLVISALRAAALADAPQATLLNGMIREYARDLRRNSSGGDDYPWEWAKATADYLEVLIERANISARDPFNRKQVEAVCRAVCAVEGADPDYDDDAFSDDPRWTRYADAVAAALDPESVTTSRTHPHMRPELGYPTGE